jgi:hypothetical protein
VHHYLAYLDQTKRSIPLTELFEEFLSVKQQDNVSPKYLADLRSKLGRFVNSFHGTLVCNLAAAQIEAWIRSLNIGTVSRESYRRNVGVLLESGPPPRISSRQSCGRHQNQATSRRRGVDSYAG